MQIPTDVTAHATAPLRHRLRLELDAPPAEVWRLAGNHARLPEYSAGIARVEVASDGRARTCHFRAPDGSEGIALTERIRWEEPGVGYSASAEPGNAFGLSDDLSIITLAPTPGGTRFTWEQYYHNADLATARASFHEGLADIGQRLVARFGGRIVEQYVDVPIA
jgi:hypothetical protein